MSLLSVEEKDFACKASKRKKYNTYVCFNGQK